MANGYNAQILRIAYAKTSALASALGITINEGDLITDAMITAAGLTFQQLAISGDISEHTFLTEALSNAQFGQYSRGDLSIKGFEKPEGSITRIHDNLLSTTHLDIFENGLGELQTNSGNTDTVASDVNHSTTVTMSGTSLDSGDVGKFIQIGNQISVLNNVATSTLTLESKISASAGDTITVLNHFDLDTVTNESFILFVETAKDARLVSHVRFGIDFETPANDLLKLKLNYQGDFALLSTLTWSTLGTITAEVNEKNMTTTHFKGVRAGSVDNMCAASFNFKMTREMTRLECQATESGQGNGGTFREKYMSEIEIMAYDNDLRIPYIANDYITLVAQKLGFAIYDPGALIKSEDPNVINNNVQNTTYVITGNADMTKKMIMVV